MGAPREACPPHRNLGQRHRQGRHGRAESDTAPPSLSRALPRPSGMAGKQDDATISRAYREHRPYLVDLAFRMLGDLGAAEDVVQDAFARLLRAGTGEIDDERGWLIVVTSRLALDQIRSARSRRERAHDPDEIEFSAPRAQPALADPADRITFDDGVRLALLVMLMVRLAGRRFFPMAQIHHVGRRSGKAYVTPTSAQIHGDVLLIPLTFGNRSDWSRNVRAAAG